MTVQEEAVCIVSEAVVSVQGDHQRLSAVEEPAAQEEHEQSAATLHLTQNALTTTKTLDSN